MVKSLSNANRSRSARSYKSGCAAPGAFQLSERVGVIRPAHCTALGKVLLGALRADHFDRFLARVELTPVTLRSITEPDASKKDIDEVRRSDIAYDDGESYPEVRCVAVPVKDFKRQVIGAIGISGPVWRLSIRAPRSRAITVQAAAKHLSAEFGYRD